MKCHEETAFTSACSPDQSFGALSPLMVPSCLSCRCHCGSGCMRRTGSSEKAENCYRLSQGERFSDMPQMLTDCRLISIAKWRGRLYMALRMCASGTLYIVKQNIFALAEMAAPLRLRRSKPPPPMRIRPAWLNLRSCLPLPLLHLLLPLLLLFLSFSSSSSTFIALPSACKTLASRLRSFSHIVGSNMRLGVWAATVSASDH